MVHPASDPDLLIRELVTTRRAATPEEVARIIELMATAPFDRGVVRVRVSERDIQYGTYRLERDTPSLIYHLVKRVRIDGQWAIGTSPEQYLADLRGAVREPSARLGVYARRGGLVAAVMADTTLVLPEARRTPDSLAQMLVVYSADRGWIVSGYQVASVETTGIPEDVLWLR